MATASVTPATFPTRNVARWNDIAWSSLGTRANNTLRAFAGFDAGGGTALYAGGSIPSGGFRNTARCDGAT